MKFIYNKTKLKEKGIFVPTVYNTFALKEYWQIIEKFAQKLIINKVLKYLTTVVMQKYDNN